MSMTPEEIIKIISMHLLGDDIESIAAKLRRAGKKVDIHKIGGIINALAVQLANRSNNVEPESACKADGLMVIGQNSVFCPLYRKPQHTKEVCPECKPNQDGEGVPGGGKIYHQGRGVWVDCPTCQGKKADREKELAQFLYDNDNVIIGNSLLAAKQILALALFNEEGIREQCLRKQPVTDKIFSRQDLEEALREERDKALHLFDYMPEGMNPDVDKFRQALSK